MYKVSYPPLPKSVGEEYQVMMRGREYHGFGKALRWIKGKGKQYHFSYNIKNIKWERGERDENLGEEIQDFKIGVGINIKL